MISRDCQKIKTSKFQYFAILFTHRATHTRLRCNKLFETAFYSLSVKNLCLSSLKLSGTMLSMASEQHTHKPRNWTIPQSVHFNELGELQENVISNYCKILVKANLQRLLHTGTRITNADIGTGRNS